MTYKARDYWLKMAGRLLCHMGDCSNCHAVLGMEECPDDILIDKDDFQEFIRSTTEIIMDDKTDITAEDLISIISEL